MITRVFPENGAIVRYTDDGVVVGWSLVPPYYEAIEDWQERYNLMCEHNKLIGEIEREIIAKSPEEHLNIIPEKYEDEEKISDEVRLLKNDIKIQFGDEIVVTLPEELKSIIPDLTKRDKVIYG